MLVWWFDGTNFRRSIFSDRRNGIGELEYIYHQGFMLGCPFVNKKAANGFFWREIRDLVKMRSELAGPLPAKQCLSVCHYALVLKLT